MALGLCTSRLPSGNSDLFRTLIRWMPCVYQQSLQWQSFIEAIRGEHAPENPADSAIVATLLLQCQIDSAKAGKEVDVAEAAKAAGLTL